MALDWTALKTRLHALARTPRGRQLLKGARWTFIIAILAFLAYQLVGIGWGELWASLPRTPWFYVLWAVLYFQLPLIESLIYRALWRLPVRYGLPVLLRKRVLNNDVAGYSGEFYLYAWARKEVQASASRIMGAVKDNAIASSLGSTLAAVITLAAFVAAGQIALVDLIDNQDPVYVTIGLLVAACLVALLVVFRRTVFTLSLRELMALFGTHLGRNLAVYGLQILQWWVVFPEAPLHVWATMLAVIIVTTRLPFLPAKDWAAMSAILGMSAVLDAPEAVIAGLLLVHSGLNHATNFILFALASAWERTYGVDMSEMTDGDAPDAPAAPAEADEPTPSQPSR